MYEKKCAINMTEVTVDEEVTSCSRPLYRRCGDTSTSTSSGLVRRRRDTLQQHIQSPARVLADTLAPTPPLVTGTENTAASVTSFPLQAGSRGLQAGEAAPVPAPGEEGECRMYHETLCSGPGACQRVPVRICAGAAGCSLQEGEVECDR